MLKAAPKTAEERHHPAKHEAGWLPERLPDGSIEGTSPTRHKYVDEPATHPIDQTIELGEPTQLSQTVGTDPPF